MISTERVYQVVLLAACSMCLIGAIAHVNDKKEIDRLLAAAERDSANIIKLESDIERITGDLAAAESERDLLASHIAAVEDINLVYMGEFKCTAYCTEKYAHICGGGNGITASGAPVQAGVSVAVSQADLPQMPFGTVIYIEGVGVRIVQDTGGMGATRLDVAVPTHAEALAWSGYGYHKVFVVEFPQKGE